MRNLLDALAAILTRIWGTVSGTTRPQHVFRLRALRWAGNHDLTLSRGRDVDDLLARKRLQHRLVPRLFLGKSRAKPKIEEEPRMERTKRMSSDQSVPIRTLRQIRGFLCSFGPNGT